MATICNTYAKYDKDGTSVNGVDGGEKVEPSKDNVEYLKCPSYAVYSSTKNKTLNTNEFPDTLGTSNPYGNCTNNQITTCKDSTDATGSKVERWTVIQSSCSKHRKDSNEQNVSIGTDIIDYTDFQNLYDKIKDECEARGVDFSSNAPSTYRGKIIDEVNPFEKLNEFLSSCSNAESGWKHLHNYTLSAINIPEGEIIRHSDVTTIATNLQNITKDCICYSDCTGYSVCYCYGNCSYY